MLNKKHFAFSLILSVISFTSLAQGQGNTPYSVLGFGEESGQTNASQDMMGGTGVSHGNGFYLNMLNPALIIKNRTAGQLKYVSMNVGLKGNYRTITQGGNSQLDFGMNLNELALSFPINKNLVTGFTLNPYSITDYSNRIEKSIVGNSTENIIYENTHKGGITRVGYINSARILKKIYVGASLYYNFGTINRDSTSFFEATETNQLRKSRREVYKGVNARLGLAFQQKINEDWQINIGGVYEKGANLDVEVLRTFANFVDNGTGAVLVSKPDTLSLSNSSTASPDLFKFGVSLESPFHWIFAADYGITQWSKVSQLNTSENQYFTNSKELALGVEYMPNSSSTKFFNQVFYRIGYNSTKTPYSFNGTQITDNKFSLGLSLPLGFRNPSYINLGIAAGRRGTVLDGNVRENYVRISTSVSLLSPWFIKPRID